MLGGVNHLGIVEENALDYDGALTLQWAAVADWGDVVAACSGGGGGGRSFTVYLDTNPTPTTALASTSLTIPA